jgi:hypothetical protein
MTNGTNSQKRNIAVGKFDALIPEIDENMRARRLSDML